MPAAAETARQDLSAAVDRLAALDPDMLDVAEAGRLVEALDCERNRLDAVRTRVAASFARRDGHRATGHKDLAHWMQDRLRRSPTQARREARTAHALGALGDAEQALGDGAISLDHAAEICEAAAKLDDPVGAQGTLLSEAASGDPRRVRKAGNRLRREDDRAAERRRVDRRAYEQRTLTLRRDEAAATIFLQGRLPQFGGEKLLTVLNALSAPAGADDDRSYPQRMADALLEIVDRFQDGRGLPTEGGVPVEITATVPWLTSNGAPGFPRAAWRGPAR